MNMSKVLSFLYGVICYVVFFVSFLYAIGFVGSMMVPKTINSGNQSTVSRSLIINLVLLGLFAIQHTIMARPGFKQKWRKVLPVHAERSTFVLVTSLLLFLLFWQWRPVTTVIWTVEHPFGRWLLWTLFWLGWIMVLLSTFMIDHFDLFGLRQVWLYLLGKDYHHVKFQTTWLYKYLRHPIMLGFIIAFWATPHMTTGHLLFAVATTVYILVGIQFEERDLIRFLGTDYEEYRRRVPMLIPFVKKRGGKGSVKGLE